MRDDVNRTSGKDPATARKALSNCERGPTLLSARELEMVAAAGGKGGMSGEV